MRKTPGKMIVIKKDVQSSAKNKTQEKPKKNGVNPWLNAKVQYRDNFQAMSSSKLWMQVIAVASVLLMLGAMAVALSTANRSNYIPYVVAVDDHGVAIASGLARQTNKADEKVIVATLAEFITNARSVTVDVAMLRRAIYSCYAHVIKGEIAREKLDEWFSGNSGVKNPFERASESLVQVSIQSVVAQTPSTYQIDWIEIERDRQGKKLKPDLSMRALVTWQYGPQKQGIDEITFNPLGIYIKDFNWSEVK